MSAGGISSNPPANVSTQSDDDPGDLTPAREPRQGDANNALVSNLQAPPALTDISLAKMHMRARTLAEARWENSTHMDPTQAQNYAWSKRVLARFKLGLLYHEKRQLHQARKRKRKAKTVDDSDDSDDDDFHQLCSRSENQKLTWLELDKAEDFKFVSQENAYKLPSQALSELAVLTTEEWKTLVLQTLVIPHQYSFTAI